MSRIYSTDYCEYTCPAVDDAAESALDDLKEMVPSRLHADLDRTMTNLIHEVKHSGTEKLRTALERCCTDLQEARLELAAAELHVQQLQHQLDNMVVAYE
jgi:hypothetical protein